MEEKRPFTSEESNLIFGKNELIEAIDKKILIKVIFKFGYKNRELENILKENKIPFSYRDSNYFKKFKQASNIIGFITPLKIKDIKEIVVNKEDIFVLALNVEDPHNLGAIIRNCESFNVKGFLFPKRRSVTITPTVIKSSTGAIFNIDLFEINSNLSTIKFLKNKGLWIISLDMSGSEVLSSFNPPFPLLLIVGGEDKGINKKILEESDFVVKIKTFGKTPSLNTSVSLGIALYEITKFKR